MAELTIRPDEIRDALARFVQDYEPQGASREEVGTVIECGDGIARVEGLPSAMANELLEFENGVRGLALNLDVREIGVVILGEFNEIEEGQQVRVDLVRLGHAHAVRAARIDLERAVLEQLGLKQYGVLIGTTWSSSPCMMSVGTVIAFRSSV